MDELNYLKSILLGFLEGISSLLPVGDSGHVLLLERMSGIALTGEELIPAMTALRTGVLLAVLIGCIKPLLSMLRHPVKGELKYVLLSCLPLLGVSLILRAAGWDRLLRSSAYTLLPFAFLFTGVILFLAQGIAKNRRLADSAQNKVGLKHAAALSLMQVLSVFPGVSLAGMELSGCLSSGLKAKKTSEFSFLSMVPALLVLYLPDALTAAKSGALRQAVNENGIMLLCGLAAAMLTGLAALKLTQWLVKKEKLRFVTLYLIVASAAVLILTAAGKL